MLFFGNPENQNADFRVFGLKYLEYGITFLIRVPILIKITQIFTNMATLKMMSPFMALSVGLQLVEKSLPSQFASLKVVVLCVDAGASSVLMLALPQC